MRKITFWTLYFHFPLIPSLMRVERLNFLMHLFVFEVAVVWKLDYYTTIWSAFGFSEYNKSLLESFFLWTRKCINAIVRDCGESYKKVNCFFLICFLLEMGQWKWNWDIFHCCDIFVYFDTLLSGNDISERPLGGLILNLNTLYHFLQCW